MTFGERWLEKIGLRRTTGRGQLSVDSYQDTLKNYSDELQSYLFEINRSYRKEQREPIFLTGNFRIDLNNLDTEDFVVAGYLTNRIEISQKPGRSIRDALKFGIGKYHGAFRMLQSAQEKFPRSTQLYYHPIAKILANGTVAEKEYVIHIQANNQKQDSANKPCQNQIYTPEL